MLVGLVGKPNVGKSTFFSAATKAPAEIANYPFTTIKPNRGVGYVRHGPCPHTLIGTPCTPRTGTCIDATRFVPVELLDVAGLVPGAHEGKGLGNQFLDDLRQADALVHVVDASGATAIDGNPVPKGSHDPTEDVAFLEDEVSQWIKGIVAKGWDRQAKAIMQAGTKVEHALHEKLAGLGVTEVNVVAALNGAGLGRDPNKWSDDDLLALARQIRATSKPLILAANKADQATPEQMAKLAALKGVQVVPTCAASELALRKATDAGLIRYQPGDKRFEVVDESKLSAGQRAGLKLIQETVLDRFGSTGVQEVLEAAVYKLLDRIVAFPVEDETHYTDKEGRVLPDAHLMKRGATAKELAFKVHTDLGNNFIRAIDARKKRAVAGDHALENGDVIRIVAGK